MLKDHAIIIGFGLPGRQAAESLESVGVRFCVVELNTVTVARLVKAYVTIIEGDGRDEAVLRAAGVEGAKWIIVAIPDEHTAVQIVTVARRLNTSARILARCHYTSTSLEALRQGANQVIVAEQAVAREMGAALDQWSVSHDDP